MVQTERSTEISVPPEAVTLGVPVAEFKGRSRFEQVISYLVAAILILMIGIYLSLQSPNLTLRILGLIFTIIIFNAIFIGAIVIHLVNNRNSRYRVILFDPGFAWVKNDQVLIFPWEQISAVTQRIMATDLGLSGSVNGVYYDMTVWNQEGYNIHLGNNISGIDRLASLIQTKVTEIKLPIALEKFNSGANVEFGPLVVSNDGLSNRIDLVPWNQITRISIDGGVITINKQGKLLSWQKIRASTIPNLLVFLRLVEHIVSTKS
jgi:hypothetical protein